MFCLITGATGHIGSALLEELLKNDYKIRVLILKNDDSTLIEKLGVEICYGDVRNIDDVRAAARGVDTIFHLAGIIGIGSGKKKLMYSVNVEGTRNIVDVCLEQNIKKLVYASSVHAIRELKNNITIEETQEFEPSKLKGAYAKTKAIATSIVLEGVKNGLDAVIVHPSGVIGPYDFKLSNTGQLILDFMAQKLYAYIDGAYDFIDVRDVAKGIVLAEKYGRAGECYILSGEKVTVKMLLDYLEDITGIKAPKFKLSYIFVKMMGPLAELYYKIVRQQPLFTTYSVSTLKSNCNFSNAKAKRELGFAPRPIANTLKDTVKWMKDNMLNNKKKQKTIKH